MSRIYENPSQALYDTLIEIRAEAIQTNNLLGMILQHLRENAVANDETVETP